VIGPGERTTSEIPVPLRPTVCVLSAIPLLLSVIVSAPVYGPPVVGENVTLIVQELPAARPAPQLLAGVKALLAVTATIVRGAVPVFLSVTVSGALVVNAIWPVKISADGEAAATGAVACPLKLTTCVSLVNPPLLSTMFTVPLRMPVVVGVNVTLIMQEDPWVKVGPQVLVWEKSPVATMLPRVSVAMPVLLNVTICALEGEPTS
jgi:hypothetical protein